jgi:hypothetical protein
VKQNPLPISVIKAKNRRGDNIKNGLTFDGLLWTGFVLLRVYFSGRWGWMEKVGMDGEGFFKTERKSNFPIKAEKFL